MYLIQLYAIIFELQQHNKLNPKAFLCRPNSLAERQNKIDSLAIRGYCYEKAILLIMLVL